MSQKFSAEDDERLIDFVRQHPPLYQVKSRSYKDAVVKSNIWKEIAGKLNKSAEDCKGRWKSIRDYYQRKKRDYIKGTGTGSAKEDQEDLFSKKFQHLRFLDTTSMVKRRTISSCVEESTEEFHDNTELHEDDKPEREILEAVDAEDRAKNNQTSRKDYTLPHAENSPNKITHQEEEPPTKRNKCGRRSNDKNSIVLNEIQKGRAERTALLRELFTKKPENSSCESGFCDPAISMFFNSIATTVSTFSPILKARIKMDIIKVVSQYEIENATKLPASSLPWSQDQDVRYKIPTSGYNSYNMSPIASDTTSQEASVYSPQSSASYELL